MSGRPSERTLRADRALEHVICAMSELGVPPKGGKVAQAYAALASVREMLKAAGAVAGRRA